MSAPQKPRPLEEILSGWGRFPLERCQVYRPESRREVAAIISGDGSPSYIARGCGRNYADASLNENAGVVSQLRLDRMLAFDEKSGVLECEGGTTLSDIAHTLLPRGFFLDVTPDTGYVTVGGAIAADAHGRNHLSRSSFASSVESLTLALPSGDRLSCSADDNEDEFNATTGGMGLTGVITRARIRLRKIRSPALYVTTERTVDLGGSLEALERSAQRDDYSICWIDSVATGRRAGRGVVRGATHLEDLPQRNHLTEPRRSFQVPVDAPDWFLSRWSIALYNALHYSRARPGGAVMRITDFMYPLDRIRDWNRLYGSRGFIQYQLVVPLDGAELALSSILRRVNESGHSAVPATLKRFGKEGTGLLSFPMEGFTLALDFPVRPGIEELTARLDRIVMDSGGRVYLGGHSSPGREALEQMYPRLDEFRKTRNRLDPDNRISSSLARRTGLAP